MLLLHLLSKLKPSKFNFRVFVSASTILRFNLGQLVASYSLILNLLSIILVSVMY